MRSVLVADDSRATRELIAAALETLDAPELGEVRVVQCASGFEALRMLPRERFDLIVTDVNMPDIHGLELVRFVRQAEHLAAVPVVVVSTEASQNDVARAMALGATDYLVKPFEPERLQELARRYLSSSAAGEKP